MKLLDLTALELQAMKTDYTMRLAASKIEQLRNKATRIMAEQEENEQLTINVEAARNDPNVRIYKNDAVITADRTFDASLREAYKATKVYEYYTSQCYARLTNLSLVRMVAKGDFSLETYLSELEEAYGTFRETFGKPDVRVDLLSLRDDIMSIPRHGSDGHALSQSERVELFRQAIADPNLIDARGYLTIPFSTNLGRLSPLTRNHKVLYFEAEIIGSDVGDTMGRIYVRQSGTGLIFALDGSQSYSRFPERTAVLNPFFNGVRAFAPEVYRSERLRDRPYVNTAWEVVLNQRDELVNKDINLNALTDVRLYVYYTDFTAL
jgi:hypothetical protein